MEKERVQAFTTKKICRANACFSFLFDLKRKCLCLSSLCASRHLEFIGLQEWKRVSSDKTSRAD